MTPIYQDKFYEHGVPEDKQRGNCLSAVTASLLDLPLAAVPNFVEIDVLGGPHWWWHYNSYLELMGYRLVRVPITSPPVNVYYTVSGLSTRATEQAPIHHIVIYRNGRMVHDPHPANDGLLTHEMCEYMVPTNLGQIGVL